MKFIGPGFYTTERNGKAIHATREIKGGDVMHGSGHTIFAASVESLDAMIASRGIIPFVAQNSWRQSLAGAWASAPEKLRNDDRLAPVAAAIADIEDRQTIRGLIELAAEAIGTTEAVEFSKILLSKL